MRGIRAAALLILAAAVIAAAPASAQRLDVLQAVKEGDEGATKPRPDTGVPAPVLTRVTGGPLYSSIQKDAEGGTTALILQLGETVRRMAGQPAHGTSWLLLSEEEGGFAKRGFWLRSDKGDPKGDRWIPDPYVDLVVDEKSIADGGFEEIFAHESGHVFLRTLFPALPDGYSRTPHASLTLTDEATAFDEGFATHFQGIARILTRSPQLRRADLGLAWRPIASLWMSEIDREMRITGMRNNLFIYSQPALPGDEHQRTRQDLSSLFDRTHLKTGEQLLASEGFVATVFYHFLADGPDDPAALAARYRPVFAALQRVQQAPPGRDGHFLPAVIQAMNETDPEAGRRMAALFVTLSYGATVEPDIARRIARAGQAGELGDMEGFVAALKPLRKDLSDLAEKVSAAPALLTKALAPPLWVMLPGEAPFDLNTGEAEQLNGLPGIGPDLARKLVESRRSEGSFGSLGNFAGRAGLSQEDGAGLSRLHAALLAAGPYVRQ